MRVPQDAAIRTAQAWWQALTPPLSQDPIKLRNKIGAEYGAAVLPEFIERSPTGGVRFRSLMSTWNPYRVVVMQTDFRP